MGIDIYGGFECCSALLSLLVALPLAEIFAILTVRDYENTFTKCLLNYCRVVCCCIADHLAFIPAAPSHSRCEKCHGDKFQRLPTRRKSWQTGAMKFRGRERERERGLLCQVHSYDDALHHVAHSKYVVPRIARRIVPANGAAVEMQNKF